MKSIINISSTTLLMLMIFSASAQEKQESIGKNYLNLNWKEVATKMPDEWYSTSEALMVADSVLKYQTAAGGWPKNNSFHRGMNQEEWARIQSSGIGATFDNGATVTEMIFLSKMYAKTKNQQYLNAFQIGLNYILKAQYKNGGWPQFYPIRIGKSVAYNSHITYNDNAIVNILRFLKDIAEDNPAYATMPITPSIKLKVKLAFDRGIDCILATQIIKHDIPTVWCAQHDEETLKPANARSYELASFSGSESVGITLLLMDIKDPSVQVINAVKGAVNWFKNHKLEGIRLQDTVNTEGKKDKVVVQDKTAPSLWARFYDLETGEAFFSDRDGVKRKTFAELGYERRNGYSWYTNAPERLFKNYQNWAQKNVID